METEKKPKIIFIQSAQQIIIGAVIDFFSKSLIYWNKKKSLMCNKFLSH